MNDKWVSQNHSSQARCPAGGTPARATRCTMRRPAPPKGENARLILTFGTNTKCEDMAYRSFRSQKSSARGVRTVTTGISGSAARHACAHDRCRRVWPRALRERARLVALGFRTLGLYGFNVFKGLRCQGFGFRARARDRRRRVWLRACENERGCVSQPRSKKRNHLCKHDCGCSFQRWNKQPGELAMKQTCFVTASSMHTCMICVSVCIRTHYMHM